ncbi:MAG: hypothetical protein UY01_C0002G0015 [Candidatus Nomurabacteria bacterium GW2011_GWB1_47_6]|uniref:O-antigen ligase-related domain-containing protein n=1 Tax=Candidatus Nomurabacteria bacterium GW2011_GWB1_47_6 TaxID=1618749 RepID=A0A0G1T2A2_9BACT|nr:MAG: hypothetical protein UY01_C0002G0015 [Candidatus Nomurabacteria bacterium GW2011_GWB1_47_6]
MNKNFEKFVKFTPVLARFTTYLLFFLMPLAFFKNWMFPSISSRLPLFYIFSTMAFCSLALNLIFRSENRPTKKQFLPMLPVALLIISLGISGFLAPLQDTAFWSTLDRGDGWFFLFHLFLLIVTVFILMLKDHSGAYKKNILWAVLCSAGIAALTVWLGNEGFNAGGRILSQGQGGGLLGNSSLAATYLLFALSLGLSVVFSREAWSAGMRKFALAAAVLIIASPIFINFNLWRFAIPFQSIFSAPQVLLGSGRGVAVGIILGIVVALAARLIYAQRKILKIIGLCIVAGSIAGYLFFFAAIQKPETAFQEFFKEQAGGNRLVFWEIARKAIADRPVFGWGLENFSVPFHRNFDPALIRVAESSEPWTDRAHNIFYDMAVAGGYTGLILFIAVIGTLVWGIYIVGKKGLISFWSAAVLLGGMYAYLFQGLFVFDTIFSYLMFGLLYAFIFGLLGFSQNDNRSAPQVKGAPDNMVYKTLGAGAVTLGLMVSMAFVAWPLYRTAFLLGRIPSTPILERTSIWRNIRDNNSIIRQTEDLARLALYVETEFGRKRNEIFSPGNEKIRATMSKDFEILGSALDKNVEFQQGRGSGAVMYMTWNTAARIYNSSLLLSGKKDEKMLEKAEYYGRESIKESLRNPQAYWILAQTLVLEGKINEADEMLEKAIAIDPKNAQSHRVSIQLAAGIKDQKMVALRTLRAKQYIPDFSL